jgi:enoyl-CoA hydratase/carnithine racemase
MQTSDQHPDIGVEVKGHIALVEIRRAPYNYFDAGLLGALADVYEALDRSVECRAIVLATTGQAFCAGSRHSPASPERMAETRQTAEPTVSREAIRLFRTQTPVVAAIHGAATGGGLGLALSADFRVTCPKARFWANFSQLGLHAGFGLTVTLPRLIGAQQAAALLCTGRRVNGEEAVALGLADILVGDDEVRVRSVAFAGEIARAAPLTVRSMRNSLRHGFADAVESAMGSELQEQTWQRQTEDFTEGVRAMSERRPPVFIGR